MLNKQINSLGEREKTKRKSVLAPAPCPKVRALWHQKKEKKEKKEIQKKKRTKEKEREKEKKKEKEKKRKKGPPKMRKKREGNKPKTKHTKKQKHKQKGEKRRKKLKMPSCVTRPILLSSQQQQEKSQALSQQRPQCPPQVWVWYMWAASCLQVKLLDPVGTCLGGRSTMSLDLALEINHTKTSLSGVLLRELARTDLNQN